MNNNITLQQISYRLNVIIPAIIHAIPVNFLMLIFSPNTKYPNTTLYQSKPDINIDTDGDGKANINIDERANDKIQDLQQTRLAQNINEKLELKAIRKEEEAALFNSRSERYKTLSVANSRAVAFEAIVRNTEKAKAEAKTDEEKAKAEAMEARIPEYQERATVAIEAKRKAVAAYDKVVADVTAARAARGEDTSKVA